jgi:hypothetical protein
VELIPHLLVRQIQPFHLHVLRFAPHCAAKPHLLVRQIQPHCDAEASLKLTSHSAALRAAHEGKKVEIALQAGAESTPRVSKGHVELLRGFAAQHSPPHSAARSAAHEGEKVEIALQAGAASPHRAPVQALILA